MKPLYIGNTAVLSKRKFDRRVRATDPLDKGWEGHAKKERRQVVRVLPIKNNKRGTWQLWFKERRKLPETNRDRLIELV